MDERWDPKNLDLVKALPWKTEEAAEVGTPAVAIKMSDREVHEEKSTGAKPAVPRSLHVQTKDLEGHGYSA